MVKKIEKKWIENNFILDKEKLKELEYPLNIDKCLDMNYTIEKCKTGYNYLIQIPLYHLSIEKIVIKKYHHHQQLSIDNNMQ